MLYKPLIGYLKHGTPAFALEAVRSIRTLFGTSLQDESAKPLMPVERAALFLASKKPSGILYNLDPLTRDAVYRVLRDSGHEEDIDALAYNGKRKAKV